MVDATGRGGRARPATASNPLTVSITAPEEFGLLHETPRKRLLRFIAALKRLTLDARKRVRIDFVRTRKMFPEGTLLFAAELDVILSASDRRGVRCNRASDRVVDQLLRHLGLYAKMRQRCDRPIEADNVRFWKVKTDTLVDGSHTESIINEYKEHFSDKDSKRLYDGLTEAMTNAKQHAYTTKKGVGREPRWWMYSQLKDGKLSVSFCDLGIGFRQSLLSGENFAVQAVWKAVDMLGGRHDGHFIQAAFELGKSRTKEAHRGKGLQQLREAIESVEGHLRILSHAGGYSYNAADRREQVSKYGDAVFGTVISWQVPLVKA
jgi:hypothetical protein